MPRWIGLLGSWALLVLGLGIFGVAVAAEGVNLREDRKFDRYDAVDAFLGTQNKTAESRLKSEAESSTAKTAQLRQTVEQQQRHLRDLADSDQTIFVSTAENKLWVKRGGETVYEAVVSTGKGTSMIENGRTMVFNTPIGKFHIISKEENPVWVPPDWHYVEEARKSGMRVVRLNRGESIDVSSGSRAGNRDEGVWSWLGSGGSVLKVEGNDVVEVSGGVSHPLPPGEVIRAGGAIIIPPVGTRQRQFDKVLGSHRLNLGDGYALHGTQATDQLGRSVSHGCVRLGDADIRHLYEITKVGDEVVIY